MSREAAARSHSSLLSSMLTYRCTTHEARERGMVSYPLTPEVMTLVAARFKVLGEPVRLQLLHVLQQGEQSVNTEYADAAGNALERASLKSIQKENSLRECSNHKSAKHKSSAAYFRQIEAYNVEGISAVVEVRVPSA